VDVLERIDDVGDLERARLAIAVGALTSRVRIEAEGIGIGSVDPQQRAHLGLHGDAAAEPLDDRDEAALGERDSFAVGYGGRRTVTSERDHRPAAHDATSFALWSTAAR